MSKVKKVTATRTLRALKEKQDWFVKPRFRLLFIDQGPDLFFKRNLWVLQKKNRGRIKA